MPEERKLVTILFADVAGSTALGDRMDPEDVRALMSRYYEHARLVMPRFGGTLEKFIGDAVMAVFGLEQSHGDDAERALAAALALSGAIRTDEILSPIFQLRIGVNTGEVIAAGDRASHDFLVTGDAVNVAARLQQSANPGEIIAGERTARAAWGAFSFEEERQLVAKGKPEPVRAFPVRGPRSQRRVAHPAFVGRRQDLLQLEVLSARALEERRPQLISILAPAGGGKSRLLEEFVSHLDPADGWQVAVSRCLPYGQTLTFWPLRGLLRDLLGSAAGAEEEAQKQPVCEVFQAAGYQTDDAERLADHILTTLGAEERLSSDRESIFTAWRLLIEALALRSPRVIVFEDLHWASDSLLDLVEHILHVRTSAALLLVALSRPELLDRRPAWGGGRQNAAFLSLSPLPDRQTGELIGRQGYPVPTAVRDHIIARSGGNPFFALELLNAYVDAGRGGDSSVATLPDSVHAAVLARIDQLAPGERSILQAASVVGRSFGTALLAELTDSTAEAEMRRALDGLLARDLIVPIQHDRYDFRHILIRDVAYGTLSRSERIRLHSHVALFLRETSGELADQAVELIAYHYREAIQLSRQSAVPLALPFRPEQTVPVFARAGVLAGRTGAYVQAKSHLQLAIELAQPAERVSLYEQLGDSVLRGDVKRQAYRDAIAAWRARDDGDLLTGARLLRKCINSATRDAVVPTLSQDEVEALRSEALALVERVGDEDERWRIQLTACFDPRFRSTGRVQLGDVMEQNRELARVAADYFERRADVEGLSEALDGYCLQSLYTNATEEAISAAERRFAIPDLPPAEWANVAETLATVFFFRGRFETCSAFCRRVFAELKPGQSLAGLGLVAAMYAQSVFASGAWDECDTILSRLDEIRELVRAFDETAAIMLVGGYIAMLNVAVAREDNPRIDALSALIRRDGAGLEPALSLYLDDLIGDTVEHLASRWNDDILITDTVLLGMLTQFNEHGRSVPDPTLLREVQATADPYVLYHHLTDIAQALVDGGDDLLAQAVDAAEAEHFVVHAARMRLVLARRTGDLGQLTRAQTVLERLADRRYLRKLEEVEHELERIG